MAPREGKGAMTKELWTGCFFGLGFIGCAALGEAAGHTVIWIGVILGLILVAIDLLFDAWCSRFLVTAPPGFMVCTGRKPDGTRGIHMRKTNEVEDVRLHGIPALPEIEPIEMIRWRPRLYGHVPIITLRRAPFDDPELGKERR